MLFSESKVAATETHIQVLSLCQNDHLRAGKRCHLGQKPLYIILGLGRAQKLDSLSQNLGSEADRVSSWAFTHLEEGMRSQE